MSRKMRQRLTPDLIAAIRADLARPLSANAIADRRGVARSQVYRVNRMPKPKIVADMTFADEIARFLPPIAELPKRERATQHGIPKCVARDFAPKPLPVADTSGRSYTLAPRRST